MDGWSASKGNGPEVTRASSRSFLFSIFYLFSLLPLLPFFLSVFSIFALFLPSLPRYLVPIFPPRRAGKNNKDWAGPRRAKEPKGWSLEHCMAWPYPRPTFDFLSPARVPPSFFEAF